MKITDKLEKLYFDALKENKLIEVFKLTPEEYKELMVEHGTYLYDQKPQPPIKSQSYGSYTEGGLFHFGYGSYQSKEYDHHAPEYLKALKKYEAEQDVPKQVIFLGIPIEILK